MKAMTDDRAREVVEALREFARRRETYSDEAGQAADEIERLRAEVRTLDARLASGRLVMGGQRLAEIEARANAATPGPWSSEDGPRVLDSEGFESITVWVVRGLRTATLALIRHMAGTYASERDANAAFIAHARQDVPELVAEVKRLRRRRIAQRMMPGKTT